MTTPPLPGPVDVRRAAALLIHANPDRTDWAGVGAIVQELHSDGRVTELVLALASIAYGSGAYPLGTPEGQSGLANIVTDYAHRENNTREEDS